ncbi:MAG: DinB family protein [Candidatus Tectimicrobiota bacterium]
MPASPQIEERLTTLAQSVTVGLAYFEGPGGQSTARIGRWSPREVLCHLLWWHQVTVEGLESVAAGGAPYRIYASVDEMNARAVARLAGRSMEQLADMTRQWQERLLTAARAVADPNTAIMILSDGNGRSLQQRLDNIILEWNTHVKEWQAFSAA